MSIILQSGLCSSKNHCFWQYVFALELIVRGGGEHLHVFHLSHMSRTAHYLVANYTICTTIQLDAASKRGIIMYSISAQYGSNFLKEMLGVGGDGYTTHTE